jgi:hypothetical protein
MKLVMAIVRPHKVTDVTDALEALNLPGLTVTEVRGHGRQRGHTSMYRGKEYDLHLLPKVKIGRFRGGRHHDGGADGRDRRRPRLGDPGRAVHEHPHRRNRNRLTRGGF